MTPEEIRKRLIAKMKKKEEEMKANVDVQTSTHTEDETEVTVTDEKLEDVVNEAMKDSTEPLSEEDLASIESEVTNDIKQVSESATTTINEGDELSKTTSVTSSDFEERTVTKPKVTHRREVSVSHTPKKTEFEFEREVGGGLVQVVKEFEEPSEAELYDAMQAVKMEVMPEAIPDYVVMIAGKPVLTYMGILKAAVERGNIEVTVERIERTSRRVVYKAIVRDLERNIKLEGIGIVDLDIEEEKIKRLKEKYKNDPYRIRNYDEQLARLKEYMEQIAFSRAQRNALKLVIDERYWAYKWSKEIIRKG